MCVWIEANVGHYSIVEETLQPKDQVIGFDIPSPKGSAYAFFGERKNGPGQ